MFLSKRQKYRNMDDQEIVQHFQQKNERECIGILYERYGHLVMGACLKYLKDAFEAQEITAKIFEELPDKIVKYEIQYFKAWIYQVTRNECLQFLRKQKHRYLHVSTIENLAETDLETDEKEALLQHLESALSQLNDVQRTCITLFYLENKSYVDISTQLQLDLKTVKSALQNGKRMLKVHIETKEKEHENNR